MRLRQVVIAAAELDETVAHLTAVFGLGAPFHDPGVAEFGLVNAVLPVGDTFFEVVTPTTPTAPAHRFLERRGDGGYMVILQTDDLAAVRRRLAILGVRVVWQIDLDDISGTHLHPRDVGGAIVSLDEARPPASWRWAGPGWQERARHDTATAVTSVDLAAGDPEALAARWARVLDRPARSIGGGRYEMRLASGTLRFERSDTNPMPHVAGYGIAVRDCDRVRGTARARGLRVEDDAVWIAGARLGLTA